jgi:hypothetical protein
MSLEAKPEGAEKAEIRGLPRGLWSAENAVTDKVIGAAVEVHRHLGVGFKRQVHLPVAYKGIRLDCGYKMDLVVEDLVIVEIKAVDQLLPIHSAQLITYLKSSGKRIGLLINFNVTTLKNGLKRIANRYTGPAQAPLVSASSAPEAEERDKVQTSSRSLSKSLRNPLPLCVSAVNEEAP